MTEKKRYLPIAAIAAVALVAAACSTDSDDLVSSMMGDGDMDMSMDMDMEVDACDTASQACVDALKTALEAAEAALTALEDADTSTLGQIAEAEKAVTDAMMALEEAEKALADYMAMQPPTIDIEALATAVDAPAALDAGLTAADGDNDTLRGGKVTATGYEKAAWPASTRSGWADKWAGSVYEEDATAMTTNTVVIYTNIEDPGPSSYTDYYTGARPGVSQEADGTTGALMLVGTYAMLADLIVAEGLPSGMDQLFTFETEARPVPMGDDALEGMFNGVPGSFSCANACTATTDGEGALTLGGDWTFTPDSELMRDEVMIQDVDPDTDYLDFGYWVRTVTDEDDAEAYMVNTFARGELAYASVADVTGSAEYAGAAVGLYTKRADTVSGVGDVEAAGAFTAVTTLTATFGQPDGSPLPAGLVDSISGKITDFRDYAGDPIDTRWTVLLNKIGGTDGVGTFAAGFTGGTTNAATTADDGTWSGQFYGDPGADNAHPTSVAGEFDASFNNGDVIGAFGATIQP